MNEGNSTVKVKGNSSLPWSLLSRWFLGLYLIVTCITGAYYISLNWQHIHDMHVLDPNFNLYPGALAWGGKLISGFLLLFRSKWLLVTVPVWIGAFSFDFLSRNTFSQLPGDFFLAFAIQICILSFVLWLHGRGRLK